MPYNLVKLRVDAMFGAISETPKMTAAIDNNALNCEEIPFPFSLSNNERTPIIKKRFAIPTSITLIQVASAKTWGIENKVDAPATAGRPAVKSTKVHLMLLTNAVCGPLDHREYHEKVSTKINKTVKVLSVTPNLGFTREMMKTIATMAR
jgi:hypothetical protein